MQLPSSRAANYRPTRRIASSSVWTRPSPTSESYADADVHQSRRADGGRVRLDEIHLVEQVLRAEEHLQAASDVAHHGEVERCIAGQTGAGKRGVARLGQRRRRDEVDVLVV